MVEVMELRTKEKRIFEKLLDSHRKMEYESERDAVAVGAMIEEIMKEAHEPIGDTIQCTREEAKDIESALKKVKDQKENYGFMDRFTVDENWEVTKALEKQIQIKPIALDKDREYCKCPICGEYVVDYCGNRMKYCRECGQKLDWGNEYDRD